MFQHALPPMDHDCDDGGHGGGRLRHYGTDCHDCGPQTATAATAAVALANAAGYTAAASITRPTANSIQTSSTAAPTLTASARPARIAAATAPHHRHLCHPHARRRRLLHGLQYPIDFTLRRPPIEEDSVLSASGSCATRSETCAPSSPTLPTPLYDWATQFAIVDFARDAEADASDIQPPDIPTAIAEARGFRFNFHSDGSNLAAHPTQ